jgi:putative transposase
VGVAHHTQQSSNYPVAINQARTKIMSNYRRTLITGGTYFFTVNLADRRSRLLTEQIERLRQSYRHIQQTQPFEMIAICILPEHLHALWRLPPDEADYSTRWQRIKAQFSKGLPVHPERSASQARRNEKGLWQRRFWEHCIRDEQDLQRHIDYIHYNPVKHGWVQSVIDWPYSSFHRYVRAGRLPGHWAGNGDIAQHEGVQYGE